MLRQFQSSSGRTWCVQLAPANRVDRGLGHDVLRFWSPGMSCDLNEWPTDWEHCPEPTLKVLLERALNEWLDTNRS